MALLRHFGGPSRLLDVTRSPYVAAFFAFNDAAPDDDACIWAVGEQAITVNVTAKLNNAGENVGRELMYTEDSEHTVADLMDNRLTVGGVTKQYPLVVCVEPFRLNERISIQQGLFILPLSLVPSAYDALLQTLNISQDFTPTACELISELPPELRRSNLVKIVFPGELRKVALQELHLMNISAATLYPGLEGFAQSLRTRFSTGDF
jgi:hypothetical protein